MADTNQQSPPPQLGPVQFLMSNKLETAMWLSRLFTVYCSIMFILPILGPYAAANFYQRALLANALTSALRLHQRLPHIQLSRAFLAQALQEDSCHYLLFSLILVYFYLCPVSTFAVYLFSLLHATTYTKKVLDSMGPNSLMFVRNLLDKLGSNQQNILKFIACNEIFLMPATVIHALQWPRKLAAAVYLLQIPDPALHIQKKSLLPHLVHRAANSSGAFHHEASLSSLLQENMSQQYRLRQPSGTHRGLISPC
uniref:Transmembrane protein 33 n=1 Tax=Tetraodon nigroviridis TaxID=99883 RepID=H3D689_TETNG